RRGRLDEAEMEKLFREAGPDAKVYDATHPFAVVVTENIRAACEKAGCRYIRVLREDGEGAAEGAGIRYFASAPECAEALAAEEGSVLLTTGSKELGVFAAVPRLAGRLYARVLPSAESIGLCAEAGLEGKHVIAMHGPFSKELNKAIISQYGIDILVTKETGKSGGFPEKIEACREAGIKAFVIGRPAEAGGVTVEEALAEFGTVPGGSAVFDWSFDDGEDRPSRIFLIGIGPGSADLLTGEARKHIEEAEIIFGAPRMLEPFPGKTSYPYYKAADVLPVIYDSDASCFAVLFSGDSGFFSGAVKMKKALDDALSASSKDYSVEIIPGISSLSYFASRLGADYSDAALMSIHGSKDPGRAADALLAELRKRGKVFTLLSGREDAVMLAEKLRDFGPKDASMFLGRDLSYPRRERVHGRYEDRQDHPRRRRFLIPQRASLRVLCRVSLRSGRDREAGIPRSSGRLLRTGKSPDDQRSHPPSQHRKARARGELGALRYRERHGLDRGPGGINPRDHPRICDREKGRSA
ncbi:MAG: precorrin-6A reductase, partial [Firmicutes bacterium]|nr:precorrin-6A reductase [Bacillota bacterium]